MRGQWILTDVRSATAARNGFLERSSDGTLLDEPDRFWCRHDLAARLRVLHATVDWRHCWEWYASHPTD
ncbi:MAG: hypothetical protein U0992_06860 [Planctomycetaceae bacterium]